MPGCLLDDGSHQRNEALAAFQVELLVLPIRDASSMLEHFRGNKLLEKAPRVGIGETRCRAHRLHARIKPTQLVVGANVGAFKRDRAAIARLQPAQEFRQREPLRRAADLDW